MKYSFPILFFTIIATTLSSPAFALGGLEFLAKSPIAYFTATDSRILKDTLNDVLDHQPTQKTIHWKNEKSGHHGKMKVVKRFTEGDMPCGTVIFFNSANGVTGQGKFDFCKDKKGEWKVYR